MTRHAMLPPFLQKLKTISETVPSGIADWSADGLSYVVKDSDKFEEVLKQHFKGSLQTFIRQLHFYGFRKLDVQNGGWSFQHKNFRKDKPELVMEIRRKTRSDANANGAATQVEVQELRSQVARLQDVVENLRTQLDSVLTVLDTAGVVDVVKKADGKVGEVRLPERGPAPVLAATAKTDAAPGPAVGSPRPARPAGSSSPSGRKRFRSSSDADEADASTEADAESDRASSCVDVDIDVKQERDEPDFAHFDFNADGAGDDDDDLIEPLSVDMDGIDDLFDLGGLMESSAPDLAAQLEADLPCISSSASGAAAAATTAKVVADATELDPASVQKVLGFLKKAIKSESANASASATSLLKGLPEDLLSFPRIQNAILNYKNVLPTQRVGAN